MNYLYQTTKETYQAAKYRYQSHDINEAAKVNGKISLSLAHENHGYRLADNPPIYLNDGRNVSLRGKAL